MEKGSNKYIPIVKRAVPESWNTSNGTFITKKVGEVKLSFVEYSASKEGAPAPRYCRIFQRRTTTVVQPYHWQAKLHDIGAVLDFKEKTITIDDILLPMRNINNLQLKPSISRALRLNSSIAQELTSTRNATKCVVEILDAKYDKADLPSIVKTIACT